MIVRRRDVLLTALSLAAACLLAPGCSKSSEPVDPVWGKEPCAHCAMLVSDKRFAAEIVLTNSERRFFDDIGCMVLWLDEQQKMQPARSWVHDADGQAWLEATAQALYFEGAKTPMDFGFEARAAGGPTTTTTAGAGIGWNEMRGKVRQRLARQRSASPSETTKEAGGFPHE